MPRLRILLFGGIETFLDGERITGFAYDKVRALFAYLAVEMGHPQPRETLAGLLWPDHPEERARQNLSQALFTLRDAIDDRSADPPFLHMSRSSVQFNRDSDHWLDVSAFLGGLDRCQSHPHTQLAGCEVCRANLEAAVDLYRDDFLVGFSLPGCGAFDEWVLLVREHLRHRALTALTQLTESCTQLQAYDAALQHARRQLTLDPWREGAHRSVMRSLALLGQRNEVLVYYEDCSRMMLDELGVAPEPETTALFEAVRSGSLSGPGQGQPPINRPVSAPGPSSPPSNLPVQLTPFIGRARELQTLEAHIRDPGCRLLTLCGPGGSGKTRLALEIAGRCILQFPNGAYLIPLAAPRSRESIVPVIAETIGLSFVSTADPVDQLCHYLQHRRMIIILDGFENVVDGLDVVLDILTSAPGVKIILTSRLRVNVKGETIFPVYGLFSLRTTPTTSHPSRRVMRSACSCRAPSETSIILSLLRKMWRMSTGSATQ